MTGLPLNTGAVEWVERQTKRTLTIPEREIVTILCAAFACGPWNVHRSWTPLDEWPGGASMVVRADLSTYDGSALTRLVFAAHDRSCRVTVEPCNPQYLRVRLWPRSREGRLSQRHPSLEDAVTSWRAYTEARNG